MLRKFMLNLHLFDDGGNGATAGEGSNGATAGENTVDNDPELARIPERARERYKKAKEKVIATQPQAEVSGQASDVQTDNDSNADIPFAELIKSEKYKGEMQNYMNEAFKDRFKKFEGNEARLQKALSTLEVIANKYDIDMEDEEHFLENIANAVNDDTSYFENYAIEHDLSPQEAKRIANLESQVKANNKKEADRQREAQHQDALNRLYANAEATKQLFPNFDLATEMQNEDFRNMVAVTNGDTRKAYIALHFDEIVPNAIQSASKKVAEQTVNAIASNGRRPTENGVSSTASAVVGQTFKGMNKKQLSEWADEQRRKARGY